MGDLYESLYGFWTAQEREEFDKGLVSSQLFGWGSYLVRLAALILISPSNLWDGIQKQSILFFFSLFFVSLIFFCSALILIS